MAADRLLVVDDDPEIVEVVEAAFRDRDVVVDSASSGEKALSRLNERRPDAILLDVRLPEMDGLEMCRILQDRGIDIPVILTSSHTTMDLTIEAMQEGAYDYLDKPIRPSTLIPLVEKVLRRKTDAGAGSPFEATPVERDEPAARLVGKSPAMVDVYKTIGRVARTNATVLITGESGTGKELVARVIHRKSRRHQKPFQVVNCAAIPETLLESELFGHEKGAFTGASQRKPGKFELAGQGTLFLDEVAELPVSLQPKLLRALEEREIDRLGGTGSIPVHARLLAATNRNLEEAVAEKTLRQDLYYRLAVVRIEVPPLRHREGDVRLLVDYFVDRLGPEVGRRIERVSEDTYRRLEEYDWPGNVRELRNVVERSLILGRGSTLQPGDIPELGDSEAATGAGNGLEALSRDRVSLEEVEKRYILNILHVTDGNQSRAARILGIHRSTLRRKIERHQLEVPS